ncbi:ABC transporter permease [Mycobacteroides saopaulense]|uniref:ABC transporter permease n=1 Tax=Mycobacteroides saopaulense TaxID=1578165 RepID=A0A1S4VEJ4_9MYCO|nr:ABC transporter permease subunit [Mycobacteroides saopaulense]ALR11208.1 ABC transporter permease [Mycobacteroides saopaulense]ORB59644.1 ABC transporter permease [Mycobacteroides saopaulense]
MLLWTRRSRMVLWAVFAAAVTAIFVAPIATVVLAGFSGEWTGPLPSQLGVGRFEKVLGGDDLASLAVSLQTALIASAFALVLGTWAALSVREVAPWFRRAVDILFHLPIAIPSVAIGLGLLIAFNERPFLLGGTKWIVIVAHTALVLAFAFSSVSAALARLDPAYRQVAESLGAGRGRVLSRVTLPLLMPSLGAAAGLAIALSMGELGATVMVYPATWRTLPVTIFGLSDRGQVFSAAASTTLLLLVTLLALLVVGRIRGKPAWP